MYNICTVLHRVAEQGSYPVDNSWLCWHLPKYNLRVKMIPFISKFCTERGRAAKLPSWHYSAVLTSAGIPNPAPQLGPTIFSHSFHSYSSLWKRQILLHPCARESIWHGKQRAEAHESYVRALLHKTRPTSSAGILRAPILMQTCILSVKNTN